MKNLYAILFLLLCIPVFSQNKEKLMLDAGIGLSKTRTGYGLYTNISGLGVYSSDKKLEYTPLYSVRGKLSDGPFKYRLFFNFAKTTHEMVYDTTFYYKNDFNFRGLYPRLGFERVLWSKWLELKFGVDFLYFYELYDENSEAKGEIYSFTTNPYKSNAKNSHVTHAWGFSPIVVLGVPIKKVVFISVEAGKSYAYGTTNSYYYCKTENINTQHSLVIDEAGKPTPFYRLGEFNNYLQISVDYRFNVKK